MTWLTEGIAWYLVLAAAAWGFAPLARLVGGRLPDRGASIARPVALLAVVYPTWLLASLDLVPYSTVGLWATLAVGAICGWALAWRKGLVTREWLRALLVAELVFLVAFAAYVALRGYTPRITGTEKPMDVAFLAAGARTTEMPPPDPWFSGEPINYYYLGYLVHGSLARMADVPPWFAFNLALASTFGIAVAGAAGLGFNLVRAWLGRGRALGAAALAAFLLAIAGNLHAPIEFLKDPRATVDSWWWQGIGWDSSRVVIDHGYQQAETINEFPYFSFLLGDLHPHLTALPFTLLALAVALNLWRAGREDGRGSWAMLVVSGVAVGALYPLNSWDFPTYLLIALAAVLAAWGWSRETVERTSALLIAAVVAWLPFSVTFVPFAGGEAENLPSFLADLPIVGRLLTTVVAYGGEWTSVAEFLTVFGVGWAIAVIFLGVEGWREWQRRETRRMPGPMIVAAVIVTLVAIALPAPVLILAGAPLAVAVWLIVSAQCPVPSAQPEAMAYGGAEDAVGTEHLHSSTHWALRTAVAGCFAGAFGLVLVTEFFYIQDVFDGRYNTLFKVYYQVWTLLAIGAAAAAALLWRAAAARWGTARVALGAGVTVAVAAGLVYPVVASEQWTEWESPRDWRGLNGAAFIEDLAPDDLAAIRWLEDNAREDDVLLEAPGCQYQVNGGIPTSRMSAFTGVPTVSGWTGSERQWRGGQPELMAQLGVPAPSAREADVAAMFADPQSPLVEQYGVTLLVVGFFERQGTTACEIAGPYPRVSQPDYPGPGWEEVFASGEARIYRRVDG
ncbi:MAG: DUF2298 domain-containing protein [Thermomicrobiales bacterium]